MENRLVRIEERLDKLVEIQTEISISLNEHMRRTEIAEGNIDKIVEELKPVQEHVAILKGLGMFTGAVFAILAAIATVYQAVTGN